MICLGNICRSPLAHGIMEKKAAEKGLDWEIDSAGTGSWHIGEAPHRLSQKVARLNGVNISGQQARRLTQSDFSYYDLLLFMDRQNMDDGRAIAGSNWQPEKCFLFLDALSPDENDGEVPDPYFGGEDGFHSVYQLIDDACNAWITRIQQQNTTFARK